MRISLHNWHDGSARFNYLAIPWTLRLDALGFRFGIGLALPIRWHWNGWLSNSLLYWSHGNHWAWVFQARILVVQFGFKKLETRDRNA